MHCASESSDSESLPDLSEYFSPPPDTISAGDIIWAKFKKLYWPALVRTFYPSQKKVSIWYCDDPGKTFKLPLKNVCLFHDRERYSQILKDVKEAGCYKEHEGLTSHAVEYMRRRSNGLKDDPLKFFDQTYPYFLAEEIKKKNPSTDVSDIKIRPMYLSHEKKQTITTFRKQICNESDDSELESTDSDREAETFITNDYISKVNMQLQNNTADPFKEIDIDAVIEYILSGKVDNHLQKIKSKRIFSEHHNLFEQSIKNNKKSLNEISFTGPIDDDNKLRKLIFYLLPLYEKMDKGLNKRTSNRKSKTATRSFSYNDKDIKAHYYVASVLLPESIIFAISKIEKISLSEAKQLFIGRSEYKTKAIEKILKWDDPTILQKDESNEKHSAIKHSVDTSVCSKGKKMCIDKLGTVNDEKEILTTDLKSHKDQNVCHEVESKETVSSNVISSENEHSDKILDCILTGKADDYLKKIKCKSVPSNHRDVYEHAVKHGKKQLCNVTYTGPVKDDNKLSTLVLYLLSLYDNVSNSYQSKRSAAKKCKSVMAAYYFNDKSPAFQYVVYVWLPESIIFALSVIENVTLPEANVLFDKYAVSKPVLGILKSVNSDIVV